MGQIPLADDEQLAELREQDAEERRQNRREGLHDAAARLPPTRLVSGDCNPVRVSCEGVA